MSVLESRCSGECASECAGVRCSGNTVSVWVWWDHMMHNCKMSARVKCIAHHVKGLWLVGVGVVGGAHGKGVWS